ncbi:MAG: helix-turn-helix domain-containing protein [Planctomycetes bacterium]|nr:helix-turn-helix domain-containing protein [Planctomycetota bacterium]MBI3833183.1 helix-turn-helix domain-containing protein [Planctomycetota bacterium]
MSPSTATILTADEVAKWLRIPRSSLYKLCQDGKVPATKIGRHWRFDRATVDAWLRDRMTRNESR